MSEANSFFNLEHGWATKYYWFDIIEKVCLSTPPFEKMIKKGKFTFSKQSGTTHADIHGSTMAINFFSERFVNLLKKHNVKIKAYPIKFVKELRIPINYYYLEPVSIIKRIALELSIHSQEEKELFRKKVRDALNNDKIVYLDGSDEFSYVRSYIDISSWDGSDLCGVSNSQTILVTKKLKQLIEKAKLKNVSFEEFRPFSLIDLEKWEKKVKLLDKK